uniref:Probable chemoreceptor glutamine deamidase CheD n=1 Tax=candidate division WOR-3 bacterium TaxID=2052148 RepID=A0A7V0Z3M5_UNCW3
MATEIKVGIGEVKFVRGEVILSAYGVGSCVVLALYEPKTRTGGLAHILLPHGADGSFKHPKGAIEELLRHFSEMGIEQNQIVAKIAGGSTMFGELLQTSIGERNVLETREQLRRHSIPIVGEDVHGNWGRTIFFNVSTGEVLIKSYRHGEKKI